jgi:hypothetical protein
MTVRSPTILILLVLVGTALSAMGSLPPAPGTGAARAPVQGEAKGAFRCDLSLTPLGAGTAILARVTAPETAPGAVSGRYSLTLRAGGNAIDQGGDFEARPGETVTLGEATLPGAPEALEGELTVTAGGRSVACPREVG